MAAKSSYGSNPLAGTDRNGDHNWGGYQWPDGVPASLLATIVKGDVKLVCRKELAELVRLAIIYTEDVLGYDIEGWQTWSYENRPIGGTSSPSNHSRGRAFDFNATENPMSYTWQTDIPPAVVQFWESIGFFWGGRYSGRTDTMHFEYVGSPADVPIARSKVARMVGAEESPAPTPSKPSPHSGKPAAWPLGEGEWFGPGGTTKRTNGSGSENIKLIQDKLNRVLAAGLKVDGIYGAATVAAVKRYQDRFLPRRIRRRGLVGPVTWSRLQLKVK